jgi:hypothetical protein
MTELNQGVRQRRVVSPITPAVTTVKADSLPALDLACSRHVPGRPSARKFVLHVTRDPVILTVLLLLAIATRFYRIGQPAA